MALKPLLSKCNVRLSEKYDIWVSLRCVNAAAELAYYVKQGSLWIVGRYSEPSILLGAFRLRSEVSDTSLSLASSHYLEDASGISLDAILFISSA